MQKQILHLIKSYNNLDNYTPSQSVGWIWLSSDDPCISPFIFSHLHVSCSATLTSMLLKKYQKEKLINMQYKRSIPTIHLKLEKCVSQWHNPKGCIPSWNYTRSAKSSNGICITIKKHSVIKANSLGRREYQIVTIKKKYSMYIHNFMKISG